MEIEGIIAKLKSLGYKEEDILDIHVDGNPVPSVKTICEARTALQYTGKFLGGGGGIMQASGTGGRCNPGPTTTTSGVDGKRDVAQSRVESAHLGNQRNVAEMLATQQQHLQHGAQTVTPHSHSNDRCNSGLTMATSGITQADGKRDIAQSRVQNVHRCGQRNAAEIVTPELQHPQHGSVAQTVTPHFHSNGSSDWGLTTTTSGVIHSDGGAQTRVHICDPHIVAGMLTAKQQHPQHGSVAQTIALHSHSNDRCNSGLTTATSGVIQADGKGDVAQSRVQSAHLCDPAAEIVTPAELQELQHRSVGWAVTSHQQSQYGSGSVVQTVTPNSHSNGSSGRGATMATMQADGKRDGAQSRACLYDMCIAAETLNPQWQDLQHGAQTITLHSHSNGSSDRKPITATSGVIQGDGKRDVAQSRVQSAHLGNQRIAAEMLTPQRQDPQHGSVVQAIAPHSHSNGSSYRCNLGPTTTTSGAIQADGKRNVAQSRAHFCDPCVAAETLTPQRQDLQHGSWTIAPHSHSNGSSDRKPFTATSGVIQADGKRDVAQSRVQSAHLGNQRIAAEMLTPQRQDPQHGSVVQAIAPHSHSNGSSYRCNLGPTTTTSGAIQADGKRNVAQSRAHFCDPCVAAETLTPQRQDLQHGSWTIAPHSHSNGSSDRKPFTATSGVIQADEKRDVAQSKVQSARFCDQHNTAGIFQYGSVIQDVSAHSHSNGSSSRCNSRPTMTASGAIQADRKRDGAQSRAHLYDQCIAVGTLTSQCQDLRRGTQTIAPHSHSICSSDRCNSGLTTTTTGVIQGDGKRDVTPSRVQSARLCDQRNTAGIFQYGSVIQDVSPHSHSNGSSGRCNSRPTMTASGVIQADGKRDGRAHLYDQCIAATPQWQDLQHGSQTIAPHSDSICSSDRCKSGLTMTTTTGVIQGDVKRDATPKWQDLQHEAQTIVPYFHSICSSDRRPTTATSGVIQADVKRDVTQSRVQSARLCDQRNTAGMLQYGSVIQDVSPHSHSNGSSGRCNSRPTMTASGVIQADGMRDVAQSRVQSAHLCDQRNAAWLLTSEQQQLQHRSVAQTITSHSHSICSSDTDRCNSGLTTITSGGFQDALLYDQCIKAEIVTTQWQDQQYGGVGHTAAPYEQFQYGGVAQTAAPYEQFQYGGVGHTAAPYQQSQYEDVGHTVAPYEQFQCGGVAPTFTPQEQSQYGSVAHTHYGGVAPTFTSHQFTLTPFQSMSYSVIH